MNTHHGDTEARRNIGLLCEALTRFYPAPGDCTPRLMTFSFLRASVPPWWVLVVRSLNA
jgi:hypothetical protein